MCPQTIIAGAERRGRKLGWTRIQEPITWDPVDVAVTLGFSLSKRNPLEDFEQGSGVI